MSHRDVVFVLRRRSGGLAFAGVSLRGGHSTVWIALRVDRDAATFRSRWAQLKVLGCGYESAGRLLAVDVPSAADFGLTVRPSRAGAGRPGIDGVDI